MLKDHACLTNIVIYFVRNDLKSLIFGQLIKAFANQVRHFNHVILCHSAVECNAQNNGNCNQNHCKAGNNRNSRSLAAASFFLIIVSHSRIPLLFLYICILDRRCLGNRCYRLLAGLFRLLLRLRSAATTLTMLRLRLDSIGLFTTGRLFQLQHRIQCRCIVVKQDGGILPELVHIRQHLGSTGIAVFHLMSHCLHDDLLQTAGNIGIQNGRHNGTAIDMLNGNRNRRITVIGRSSCHHFVHDRTQRIDIRTAVYPAALCLLGRNIVHRAKGFLSQSIALGHHPGNTKVRHLYGAVLQHHHIVRFNIPVNDATAMGMLQCLGDLDGKMQGLLPVQHTLFLHILLQGNTLDQLHNDVVRHHRGGHIVNRNDIGVAEHGNSLAFRMETAAEILVLQVIILQNLDRNQPVQPVAAGFINNSHTAAAQHFQNLVPVVQQSAYVFIHNSYLLSPGIQITTSIQVTLSGAPRFLAMSSSRWQHCSLSSP